MVGGKCTGDDGLAGPGRRDQYPKIVSGQGVVGGLLLGIELGLKDEVLRLPGRGFVDDLEPAADLGDEFFSTGRRGHAAERDHR